MYKAFLFDMDGTLVDSFDLIYTSFDKALREHGKPGIGKAEFNERLFGKPVEPDTLRLLQIRDGGEHREIVRSFEKHWLKHLDGIKVFKNVRQTLESLKQRGLKLGVVSTSPRDILTMTLKQAGIYRFFDVLIGAEDTKNKKPHHEPVTKALGMLHMAPKDTVFVGDTVYDMKAGRAAGCRTVFLLNNYNKDYLTGVKPDSIISDIAELEDMLAGNN